MTAGTWLLVGVIEAGYIAQRYHRPAQPGGRRHVRAALGLTG